MLKSVEDPGIVANVLGLVIELVMCEWNMSLTRFKI